MMLSFCDNKSVHPFLNLANSNMDINGTVLDFPLPHFHHHHHQNIFPYLDSAGVPPAGKRDPGGIGFLDEVGGSVDGLMSCTESLGFESSDERSVDEDLDNYSHDQFLVSRKLSPVLSSCNNNTSRLQKSFEKKEKKNFPPPLTSLNKDGKPNFFLRAVRKDGRLELTEVKIGRPETLLASRQDGRLRLHLIRNDKEEEEEIEEQILEDEEEAIETIEEEDEYDEEEEEEDDDDDVSEWKFPVTSCGGGGGGFRRCYELGSHHHHGHGHGHNNHHHDIHVWRQHCVTTS